MNAAATTINLDQYKAGKGLPELHQQKIREQIELPILAGIDLEHNLQMITYNKDTAAYLYGEYSPTAVSYKRGSRPMLERVVESLTSRYKGPSAQIQALVTWVVTNLTHPVSIPGNRPADCNLTEEQLIERGWAWCNEQGRVLVSLAQIAGYPARMCFLFSNNAPSSHATTEIFFHDKWVFVDPTYGCFFGVDPKRPYSAREIHENENVRVIVDDQYARAWVAREVQRDHHLIAPPVDKPMLDMAVARRSDYFTNFSLCNYTI